MSTLFRFFTAIYLVLWLFQPVTSQTVSAEHFFREGGKLQDQGDLSIAIDYYTEALVLNANNPMALFNRALAYYQMDKPHKALFDLNQLTTLSPTDAEAFELRAEVHAVLQDTDKALMDYSRSILLQPTVNRYLNRALLQSQRQQFELALQDIEQAIHLDPTDATIYTVKADILMAMGRMSSAIKTYADVIAIDQQSGKQVAQQLPVESSVNTSMLLNKVFYWIGQDQLDSSILERLKKSSRTTDKAFAFYCLGLINLRQQEYQYALDYFDKALNLDSSLGEYYYGRGVSLTYLHRFDEAQKDLRAATQLGFVMKEEENWLRIPAKEERTISTNEFIAIETGSYSSNPTVQKLIDKGRHLVSKERYAEAVPLFDQAIHLDPNCFMAYFQRAEVKALLGERKAALEDYSVTLNLQPDLTEAYYERAMIFYQQGNYGQSKRDLDQVLQTYPAQANALYMRAQILMKLQHWQAALKDLNDYLVQYPEDAMAYNNRGAVKMKLGLAYQALTDFNTGISMQAEHPDLLLNRAKVKLQMGAYDDALVDYELVLQREITDPAVYHERGLVYMKLKRYALAIQDFTQAMRMDAGEKINYYYDRALAFQLANAPEAAISDYNRVLELDEKRAEALYNRGVAKHSIDDHRGANQDLSLAAKMGKNPPDEVLTLNN